MKLAFTGQGRYAEYNGAYQIYCARARGGDKFDERTYRRVIRAYCKLLSERLLSDGMVDLPSGIGAVGAAILTRKPQYRGKTFVGYGARDWKSGEYDGKLKTFGMVYVPRHDKNSNLRCLGFVANRQLFRKMKEIHLSGEKKWVPMEFNDEMI